MSSAQILVINREQQVRRELAEILAEAGYDPRLCATGSEGLARISRGQIDAVLCEVSPRDMDGAELVRHLCTMDIHLPVIVAMGERDLDKAVALMEEGARGFVVEPFEPIALADKMEKLLVGRRRALEERRLLGRLMRDSSGLRERVVNQGRRLGRTEEHMNQLLDAAPFAVISTDMSGRLLTANSTAERMYQRQEDDMVGRRASFLGIDGSGDGRGLHVRRDGSAFPALVRRRDICDERGLACAQLYVVEDLSESETLKEQLINAERLSMLGQMAPRIAHEFKNPLQLVTGYAELIREVLAQNDLDKAREYLEVQVESAEKLLQLVQQLTNLGKPSQKRRASIDLAQTVRSIIDPLSSLGLLKTCEVELDFDENLSKFDGDPMQVEQALRNLIVNAAHAMEGQSEKVLRVSLRDVGDRIECEIADSGCGMEREEIETIFEPFYSTKPPGQGTGLGLPIVKTVCERHGASVSVHSEKGVGTVFLLSIPLHCAPWTDKENQTDMSMAS